MIYLISCITCNCYRDLSVQGKNIRKQISHVLGTSLIHMLWTEKTFKGK